MGHVTWPRPFQRRFVIGRLWLAMFNPHIKFEMSTITCNEVMKGKCKNSGFEPSFGDLGVTYKVHQWLVGKRVIDFLLVLIEFFSPGLTVEALWANIGRNCAVCKGVGHFEHKFQREGGWSTNKFWRQKTIPGLSRGVVCVILRLAIPACDTQQTYRHRHTMMAIIRASLAPCGLKIYLHAHFLHEVKQ